MTGVSVISSTMPHYFKERHGTRKSIDWETRAFSTPFMRNSLFFRAAGATTVTAGSLGGWWWNRDCEGNGSSSVRNPTEDEDCKKLGLMTPSEAQKTHVARLAGFLSRGEIEYLNDAADHIRQRHMAGIIEVISQL